MSNNQQFRPERSPLPWHRFWVVLGGSTDCGNDGAGFLTDPEDLYGRHTNPSVARLTDLLPATGCIVLCGEPGIGKSTELITVRAQLEADAMANRGILCWFVFREIADLADFRRLSLESAAWQAWRTGSTHLTLVIDGVDEGLLRVPNFVNNLTALLRGEPLERLRVILACRTAEWPIETGRQLIALWPKTATERLYELCPLRRKDAEDAARAATCDPDTFLRAVWERNAVSLASRPVTLFFLLDEFRQHGGLSATHRELYERGTANLAREVDPVRLEVLRSMRRTETSVSDDERLRAAQRLAGLLLLSGRSAIQISRAAFALEHDHDLTLEAAANGGSAPVTSHALEEAVESALFTSLGEHRFGFVHQTFAECLASQHLRALPLIQLRRLLCQRDIRGEHVIPQLAELAAWVAGANSAFCDHLLRIEPEVLLRSDVTRLQGTLKSRLVDAILAGAREERIFDDIGFGRFLSGLNHPGLANQLRSVIADRQGHYIARRIAMSIAEKCRCAGLVDTLLAVIMDADDCAAMGRWAASALEDAVPNERVALLEPLARGESMPDANDEIKSHALRRLVPKHWKVRDALPYLTPRKNNRLIGAYEMFLRYSLPAAVEDADLPTILVWLRGKKGCLNSASSFHRFASVAFARALSRLDVPEIEREVIETWRAWIATRDLHHLPRDSDIRKVLAEREDIRRQLTTLLFNHGQTKPDDVFGLTYPIALIQGAESLDWLLDRLPEAPPDSRKNWAMAVARLTSASEVAVNCWDKLLSRIESVPELATLFEWLRPWDLNEKRARDAKAHWLRGKRREAEFARQEREFAPPDVQGGIKAAFARFASGDQFAWGQLWHCLILGKEGHDSDMLTCDLATCENWELLSVEQKEGASAIARAYLCSDARNQGVGENLSEAHLAARSAIWMLRHSLKSDTELRSAIIDHWLKAMVWHVDTDSEQCRALFRLAYSIAPGATRDELMREACREASKHRHPFAFRVAKECWETALSSMALQLIDSSVDPAFVLNALDELAERDQSATLEFATRVISSVPPASTAYPVHLFGALTSGLIYGAARIWPLAELLLNADDTLARFVLAKVCYGLDVHSRGSLKDLTEPALGALYLMLRRLYPPSSDPPQERSGFLSAADCARRTRRQIPSFIAARGTEAACRELHRLADMLPEEATWLRWSHRQAVTNVRRNAWQPPSPEHVRAVLTNSRVRMLTCDDDLLDLVLESLGRLQTRLVRQSLPAAEELWRWEGAGLNRANFRPKDEEAISDYIARWLTEDIGPAAGVVVNREVQPRRGARTDVIVEATTPGSEVDYEKLTVVIEVKGCWHAAVRSGLQTQLVDGYLRVHGWRCGIYLVGWFLCPQWENPLNHLQSDTIEDGAVELAQLAVGFNGVSSDFRVATSLLDCTLPPTRSPSS